MAGEEGNIEGKTGDVTGQTQQVTPPAWVSQLPTDLKANEVFTKYPTIGDLGKSHLEVMGKIKELDGMTAKVGELEGKLSNTIPKLPQNPTKEQVDAYYAALGRPGKPEDYKFEPDEGVEHDPKMIAWAQKVFWENGIPQSAALQIQKQWDQFLKGVEAEEDKLIQGEIDEAKKKFRGEFKTEDEFKAALQLNSRYYKKVMGTDIPPFMDAYSITKFLYEHAKKYGEDKSIQGSQTGGGGQTTPGMIYDKTPQHQKL